MNSDALNKTLGLYKEILTNVDNKDFTEIIRRLCRTDLFFLLTQVCRRKDLIHPWLYDRIKEVEASPDGHLDLWSRGHGKSSIITFGRSIQDILIDPNVCICIFSHTRSASKSFLDQIKRELENNTLLKAVFSDILYENPSYQSPRWSLDLGLVVKRTSNPKEATVEAGGIIEGMPTGKHYDIMVFDDLVTENTVSTPEMITKASESWELSLNLGKPGCKIRYIGTKYHYNDLYTTILEREAAVPRIRTGVVEGVPILWTPEYMAERRAAMGPYTFAAQILLDPAAEQNAVFKPDWLRWYGKREGYGKYNRYIVVDPANEKNKRSDYTAIIVFGVGEDGNYYVLDIIRDKLSLTERVKMLFDLFREYRPLRVGYEKYGMSTDIEHIQTMMKAEQFRFDIIPLVGNVSKADRIRKLIPLAEQGKIYLPYEREILHKNWEGRDYYPIKDFVNNEYLTFPFCPHDDVLDAMSRMVDQDMSVRMPGKKSMFGGSKPNKVSEFSLLE